MINYLQNRINHQGCDQGPLADSINIVLKSPVPDFGWQFPLGYQSNRIPSRYWFILNLISFSILYLTPFLTKAKPLIKLLEFIKFICLVLLLADFNLDGWLTHTQTDEAIWLNFFFSFLRKKEEKSIILWDFKSKVLSICENSVISEQIFDGIIEFDENQRIREFEKLIEKHTNTVEDFGMYEHLSNIILNNIASLSKNVLDKK